MTQETKLGLVIGGVFILCFAVILSNSAEQPIMAQRVGAFKEFSTGDPAAGEPALTGRLAAPAPQALPPVAPPSYGTRSAQPIRPPTTAAYGDDRHTPPSPPTGQRVIAEDGGAVDAASRQSPSPLSPLSSRLTETDVIVNPTPRPALPIGQAGVLDSGKLSAPRNAPAAAPADRDHYIVQAGDSLTRIAQTVYGNSAAETVERLFQANREILKSKNAVRAGQKLVIPDRPERRAPTATPQKSAERTPARPNPEPEWVWYQVKQDDRYAKIAQEQLGDASRWREIFELNSAVFPDPNRIRPGVRIKIPK